MRTNRVINLCFPLFLLIFAFGNILFGQKPSATPRQEKLLNGLKVLVWNVPGSDKVSLKLRIHAGSAFDPQDKEGVMKLLAESFFPNAEARNFFREELDGTLEVVCSYDYVQINASARSSDLITLLETVAQAISNPDLSKEATEALKKDLSATLLEMEKDAERSADRAVARRLLGTFPYGRAEFGTTASIEKIDYADLRFARERLFTSDNATLAVKGAVDPALVFRAARRYFGSWLKADKTVPSTFRQPDPPLEKAEVINTTLGPPLVRLATRGVARNDPDVAAAEVLAQILENRFKSRSASGSFARNESHVLPGIFVVGMPGIAVSDTAPHEKDALNVPSFAQLLVNEVTAEELSLAGSQVAARWRRRDQVDQWLDFETFKTTPAKNIYTALDALVLADVRRFASRITGQPAAVIIYYPPQVN